MTEATAISDRECLIAMLANRPPVQADAVVVLCGEDAKPRLDVGLEIFRRGYAPLIVLSGGKHAPPRWVDANACYTDALGQGIAHDRILVESESTNTREQAVAIAQMAHDREWSRVILVASGYHLPRAFLTVLRALHGRAAECNTQLIPVASGHSLWSDCPDGTRTTRRDLLAIDLEKIDTYAEHCTSPREGIDYLLGWERAS